MEAFRERPGSPSKLALVYGMSQWVILLLEDRRSAYSEISCTILTSSHGSASASASASAKAYWMDMRIGMRWVKWIRCKTALQSREPDAVYIGVEI